MSIPADTDEWRPIYVTQNTDPDTGTVPYTGSLDVVVYLVGTTQPAWAAAVVRDGQPGFKITGLTAGTYRVKARINNPPDQPVRDCGTFRLE